MALPKNTLIKIEVFDPDTGGKITVTVDGAIPESLSASIGKYISEVLSSGNPVVGVDQRRGQFREEPIEGRNAFSSTFDRVRSLLLKHFRYGSFTSHDVQDEFERAHGQKLRGSTVSTYLLRLSDPVNGVLDRRHGIAGYEYLLRSEKVKGQVISTEEVRSSKGSTK